MKITDFTFIPTGHGHYKVTYTSPKSLKNWTVTTSNMRLIDLTHNSESPKIKDLNNLKSICKN